MKAHPISKVLAVALTLVMLMSVIVLPMTASAASVDYTPHDDYYKVISKTDYELAPGIVESEIVLNNTDGSHRQVAHVVEVDPYNPYTKVMPSYKGMAESLNAEDYNVEVMSEQVAYAEANGYGNVVAAMNLSLSWYNSDYYVEHPELVGEPLGYLVMDGVYYENSNGKTSGAQTCLVINFDEKDGVARPAEIPKTELRSTSTAVTGWEEQVIPANFGFLVKDGVNLYAKNHTSDAAPRSFVGIKADGTIVMVMNDGRQEPYSAGFNSYEMAEFMLSLGCVQAINGDGGGSSQFLSQRPGEELELHCNPSDGAVRATTHGILVISTAPATGEFVRAQVTVDDQYYTPGSSVQFSAVGADLVGTPADIPADAYWRVAEEMGTIDKNGLFVSNGTTGVVTAELVYKDEVVGSASINIVIPDKIQFPQSTITIPNGESTNIRVTAIYNEIFTVVTKLSDFTFELSNENLGTLDGFTFSATEDLSVTEGSIKVTLVHDTTKTDQASFIFGKASEVIWDFEDGTDDWDTTMWKSSASLPFAYLAKSEAYSVNTATGKVHDGDKALALTADFTYGDSVSWNSFYLNYYGEDIVIENAQTLGCWLYIPDEIPYIEFYLRYYADNSTSPKTGVTVYGDISEPLESGWTYVSFDISNFKKLEYKSGYQFIQVYYGGIQGVSSLKAAANLNSKVTYYIDNVTVDYSTAVADREAPVFATPKVLSVANETSEELKGQTITNSINTFEVAVGDFVKDNATGIDASTAKVYVDGTSVECTYSGGRIMTSNVELADGTHTITFEIADNSGNVGKISRELKVNAASEIPTIKVVPHDATLDRILLGSLYYVDVVATDIEKTDKVVVTLDLDNHSVWELDYMELTEGFEATYTIDATDPMDNIVTITITRTGDVELTGECVIASLPIRAWQYKSEESPAYGTEYEITLEQFWETSIAFRTVLAIASVEGTLTTIDGSNVPFGGDKIEVDTELFANSSSGVPCPEVFTGEVGWHKHTATAIEDKSATCTKAGYTDRTFCEVCNSVVEWGTIIPATGHTYELTDGVLKCACGALFNGVKDDVTYVDGIALTGWVGDFYYRDGVKLTGAHKVDDVFYNFAEDGTCEGEVTGLFFDEDAQVYRYAIVGQAKSGWYMIGSDWYYFRTGTLAAATGTRYYFSEFPYEFDETGKLLHVVWHKYGSSYRCYYGPTFYSGSAMGTWVTIEGKQYCFAPGGEVLTGYQVLHSSFNMPYVLHQFDSKGVYLGEPKNYNGFVNGFDGIRYFIDGEMQKGLQIIDGNYYYFSSSTGAARTGEYTVTVANSNGLLAKSTTFHFDEKTGAASEKPLNGIVTIDGVKYCYKDSVMQKGLQLIDGNYYYFSSNTGAMRTGTYRVTVVNSNGLLTENTTFHFDAETGAAAEKPLHGIVTIEGKKYYYINNVMQTGLQIIDGNYYYFSSNTGAMRTGEYRVTVVNSNGLLTKNTTFHFDAETGSAAEKPLDGIVTIDGNKYFYKNNEMQTGLQIVDGKYYYFSSNTGIMRTGVYRVTVVNSNGLLTKNTTFTFDTTNGYAVNADGTPVTSI